MSRRVRNWWTKIPTLFWGVINSMYIGNILLLIRRFRWWLFVRILRVRPAILAPITALITILGVYTINNSTFDIFLMVAFGMIGYLMKKAGFEPGPMVWPSCWARSSSRHAPVIADLRRGSIGFFTRPISGTILAIFVVLALLPAVRQLLRRRADRKSAESSETAKKVSA